MKKYWTIFLIAISSIMFQCTESEYIGDVEFYFINKTSTDIFAKTYTVYGDSASFEIKAGDTLFNEMNEPWFTEKRVAAEEAFAPDGILSDSIRINFGSSRYLTFANQFGVNNNNCNISRSLFCFDEYRIESFGKRHFRYYYVFTDDDYNNATLISD